MEHKILPESK